MKARPATIRLAMEAIGREKDKALVNLEYHYPSPTRRQRHRLEVEAESERQLRRLQRVLREVECESSP